MAKSDKDTEKITINVKQKKKAEQGKTDTLKGEYKVEINKEHTTKAPLAIINLYRLLYELTDEDHGLSDEVLKEMLAGEGTYIGKTTIYKYLNLFRQSYPEGLGLDIEYAGDDFHSGFRMISREFDVNEVKMLADAVASARFITEDQAGDLINKLKKLVSVYQAKELNRQVYVSNRVRTKNDRTMVNVDWIHRAIADRNDPNEIPRKIEFDYYEYDVDKNLVQRGEHRVCTPYALAWSDDRYYLVASHPDYFIANYRVDRMKNIRITEEKAEPIPKRLIAPNGDAIAFDLPKYLSTTFSMFSGNKEEEVKLEFDKSLVNVVLDKFGHETRIIPSADKESFTVTVRVKIEHPEPFFAWLVNFGTRVKFIDPPELKTKYLDYLKSIIDANE